MQFWRKAFFRQAWKRATPTELHLAAVVAGIIAAAAVAIWLEQREKRTERLPDFSAMTDAIERKEAFFSYLLPLIEAENNKMMKMRRKVMAYRRQSESGKLHRREERWLERIYQEAGFPAATVGEVDFFENLLSRVDAVPPSLALAQAALESGWGTSRFAREGNNLYGIWCYTPGCGMVPRERSPGSNHEVRKYTSAQGSVADYFRVLNTANSYLTLRLIRAGLRSQQRPLIGTAMAPGLERYSERGMAYVRDIQRLIETNGLERYDV